MRSPLLEVRWVGHLVHFGRFVGAIRPSTHPQVAVVSQKRKKVDWGITNEVVRPSVGQVRSGGGEGGRGRQHRYVWAYVTRISPTVVRRLRTANRNGRRRSSATDYFPLSKKQFRSHVPCSFLQIIRLLPSIAEFIPLPSSDLETEEPAIAGGRARHTPTRKAFKLRCCTFHFSLGRDGPTEVERER